jgi:hypothetical protein
MARMNPGPRQTSHVFSLDATYAVNPQWTLGGKLGVRLGKTSPDVATPLQRKDAVLAVTKARYHLTDLTTDDQGIFLNVIVQF